MKISLAIMVVLTFISSIAFEYIRKYATQYGMI
jgi:hypothetical protein